MPPLGRLAGDTEVRRCGGRGADQWPGDLERAAGVLASHLRREKAGSNSIWWAYRHLVDESNFAVEDGGGEGGGAVEVEGGLQGFGIDE